MRPPSHIAAAIALAFCTALTVAGCSGSASSTPGETTTTYVDTNENVGPTFADLGDTTDLSGRDLAGGHFAGADFSGRTLAGADLTAADMGGAMLAGVDLHGATLEGANLEGADLQGANLVGAKLGGAGLKGATMAGADVTDVQWGGTNCVDGTDSDTNGGTCEGHL